MPQAELYGLYMAAKIAAYEGHDTVCLGVDNDTARQQALQQEATTHCTVQNRLLRRLFWLRLWSGIRMVLFRVTSTENPADPMSRVHSFPSVAQAMKGADERLALWKASTVPYKHIQMVEALPWSTRV